MNDDVAGTIQNWADAEFSPWRSWRQEPLQVREAILDYIAQDPSVFHFSIRAGKIRFHEKSSDTMGVHYPPGSDYPTVRARGFAYEQFFQSVIDAFAIKGDADLAVALGDTAAGGAPVPVVAFQKTAGSANILVPDIDFIDFDFYLADEFQDRVPFEAKTSSAVFVGSTTGYQPIHRRMVETLDHQRLRSAVHFKGNKRIRYELPVVLQCDGPETVAMIRALGLGDQKRTWIEQFSSRYIISVDGNGATCSRVALALKSNSILLKFHSQNRLYYFSGMRNFIEYLEVKDDADLEYAVDMLDESQDAAFILAKKSHLFYRKYLSRISIMQYAAAVIKNYIENFGVTHTPEPYPTSPVFVVDSFVHVQNVGDLWSVPHGSAGGAYGWPIEGFCLHPGPEISGADLSYQSIGLDGAVSEETAAWEYCGSRGQARALSGLAVHLKGKAADSFDLNYEARFADGSISKPTPSGAICKSPNGAPMVAFQILCRRKTPRS